MTNLGETSQAYEPKKTPIVSDLPSISLSEPIEERSDIDRNNKPYDYKVLIRDGVEYRVPATVQEQIQNLMTDMKNLTEVKVTKKGEGMDSKYTVTPIVDIPQSSD